MNDEKELNLQPTCVHLRHKMMYIDPAQRREGLVDVSSDTAVHFCNLTLDSLGKDDAAVGPRSCQPGRSCFEAAR
ncbi:MAG: hypothetical protein ACF8NJ_11330 [Phycisphaerales bacterium JB038]